MIVVHHLNDSRSQRVLWLLEELEIPYEIRHYQRDRQTMLAPPELKAIHPLGKSPVISDGAVTLAETGAIVEYLVTAHGQGRLKPAVGSPEALRFLYWLHYAEGSAMPPLLMKLIFTRLPDGVPFVVRGLIRGVSKAVQDRYIDPQIKLHFDYLEGELTRSTWFAGEVFSAADIMMSFPIEAGADRGQATVGRPHVAAFLERIHARPAYQRALEKGGPYRFAASK